MIKTVSDFLLELKQKGSELIEKYEIVDHPVLIGDMYEGLTKEILGKTVFDGLNLKIVAGKIKNGKGELSDEIDCMVVEGDGDNIPFTDKFIYHFSQVIAVIEVKKSLYTDTLDKSYTNLHSVLDVSREPEKDGENYLIRLLRDAWKSMLKIELPRRVELNNYSEKEQYIYHSLLMEAYYPIRIVFGYYGFKTEYSLREGFAKYLEEKAKSGVTRGFGAVSLPSLIICGNNSIIKNNGMPYSVAFSDEEFYWPIYSTSNANPLTHLLELIWTRLSYKFKISSQIFGDDLTLETAHRFINCKLAKFDNDKLGWAYNYSVFSQNKLSQKVSEPAKWSPAFLTREQFIIINILCKNEVIQIDTDNDFNNFLTSTKIEKKDFIEQLINTGLVYLRNEELRLLTDECQTVILPDGRSCAADNKNNQLTKWVDNFMEERKASR